MQLQGPITVFIVLAVSWLAVYLGQVAFELTGMPRKKAFFQSLSCFTTTGFTTTEAEEVVNHPHRRNISMVLMVLGNIGIVGLMAGFLQTSVQGGATNIGATGGAIFLLVAAVLLARHMPLARTLNLRVHSGLMSVFHFEPDPTEQILSYQDGFGIVRVELREGSPTAGKRLAKAGLAAQEVMVLAIERAGRNYPIPGPKVRLRVGDRLICYARIARADDAVNGTAPLPVDPEGAGMSGVWKAITPDPPKKPDPLGHPPPPPPPPDPNEEEDLAHGITIMRKAIETRIPGATSSGRRAVPAEDSRINPDD